mmetsp:Transcript_31467/g.79470  ORF Transcript_31467/g.79470 Transcript_31467/m.79470 type:complete len:307 (+) Transcript_31467:138-1058(+)
MLPRPAVACARLTSRSAPACCNPPIHAQRGSRRRSQLTRPNPPCRIAKWRRTLGFHIPSGSTLQLRQACGAPGAQTLTFAWSAAGSSTVPTTSAITTTWSRCISGKRTCRGSCRRSASRHYTRTTRSAGAGSTHVWRRRRSSRTKGCRSSDGRRLAVGSSTKGHLTIGTATASRAIRSPSRSAPSRSAQSGAREPTRSSPSAASAHGLRRQAASAPSAAPGSSASPPGSARGGRRGQTSSWSRRPCRSRPSRASTPRSTRPASSLATRPPTAWSSPSRSPARSCGTSPRPTRATATSRSGRDATWS